MSVWKSAGLTLILVILQCIQLCVMEECPKCNCGFRLISDESSDSYAISLKRELDSGNHFTQGKGNDDPNIFESVQQNGEIERPGNGIVCQYPSTHQPYNDDLQTRPTSGNTSCKDGAEFENFREKRDPYKLPDQNFMICKASVGGVEYLGFTDVWENCRLFIGNRVITVSHKFHVLKKPIPRTKWLWLNSNGTVEGFSNAVTLLMDKAGNTTTVGMGFFQRSNYPQEGSEGCPKIPKNDFSPDDDIVTVTARVYGFVSSTNPSVMTFYFSGEFYDTTPIQVLSCNDQI